MESNKVICPDCNGSGDGADFRDYRQGGDQFPVPKCNRCKGTGQIQMEEKIIMAEKGPADFPSTEAFLEWAAHTVLTFPFPGGKGWEVKISKDGVIITSPYYEVRSDPNGYGAPKIFGHLYPLGKENVSGLVTVGPQGQILNRRRVVSGDALKDNEKIVKVIIAQPDRVIEPVAVIASEPLENYSKDPAVWNKAIIAARDGVELTALRAIMSKIFK